MEQNILSLPEPRRLDGSDKAFPYVFVGDEVFPLKSYLVIMRERKSCKLPHIKSSQTSGECFWNMRVKIQNFPEAYYCSSRYSHRSN